MVTVLFLLEMSWVRTFAKILNLWTLGFSQPLYQMPNITLKEQLALTSA